MGISAVELQSKPATSMQRHNVLFCVQALLRIIVEENQEHIRRSAVLHEEIASIQKASKQCSARLEMYQKETDAATSILAEYKIKIKQYAKGQHLSSQVQIKILEGKCEQKQRRLREQLQVLRCENNDIQNGLVKINAKIKALDDDMNNFVNGMHIVYRAILFPLRTTNKNINLN